MASGINVPKQKPPAVPSEAITENMETEDADDIIEINTDNDEAELEAMAHESEQPNVQQFDVPTQLRRPPPMEQPRYVPLFENNNDLAAHGLHQSQFVPEQNLRVEFDTTVAHESVDLKEVYLQSLKRVKTETRAITGAEHGRNTINLLETQLKVAERYYNRLTELIERLSLNPPFKPLEQLDNNRIIEEADKIYDGLKFEIESRLATCRETFAAAVAPVEQNRTHHRDESNLNQNQRIEPFAGNFQKWPNFRSKFVQFVHSNERLTDLEKFLKLDECLILDSEAYNTISGYNRVADNYAAAWEDLCTRFDNKRKTVEECILRFMDAPQSRYQSRATIILMINSINYLTKMLPRFNVDVSTWGPILVPIAQRKMDGRTLANWFKVRPSREVAALGPLITFLEAEADSLDGTENDNNHHNNRKNGSLNQSNQAQPSTSASTASNANASTGNATSANTGNAAGTGIHRTKSSISCAHCGNNHQLFGCNEFKKLPLDLRIKRVKQYGICSNCLKPKCSPQKCTLGACRCGEKHNKLLCSQMHQPSVSIATTEQA